MKSTPSPRVACLAEERSAGRLELSRPVPIACIGMSSGGLLPLKLIFRQLSSEPGMAFVVIHHVVTTTLLPEILSFHTSMLVKETADGEVALPNHVYVLPPGMEMTVADGVFSLQPRSKLTGWPNVITIFMDSLAKSRHPGIAITLSGLGSDGAAALKAFKEHGGVAIAQAPETADREDLPWSWINTGSVDYILEPDAITQRLESFACRFRISPGRFLRVEFRRAQSPTKVA
jgi:chemotaxis response regulator CheB